MTSTVRSRFERDLGQLSESVIELGSLARNAVARAVMALEESNAEVAREVVAEDEKINTLRYAIEKQCYALIATEQPVAGDLRAIIAALTVSTDLERIGDHGKKIAKICLRIWEKPRSIPIVNITRLSELSLDLLDRAMRAYAENDTAEAMAVCQADDQVDSFYKQTFNVLLSYMLENHAFDRRRYAAPPGRA